MNLILKNDLIEIENLLEKAKTEGLSFLNTINETPTSVTGGVSYHRILEEEGLGAINVLDEFKTRFKSIIVSSSGPRYWGFVTGGATPASILGDWLATVYDQNTQSVKGQGDISAMIEWETIQLLLQLFGLPDKFWGGFVTGAMMSNFSCLATARQYIGKKMNIDIARQGVPKGIKILASTPHSSVLKALALLGVGSENIIKIKCMKGNREAIDISDLERVIKELNQQPFILLSSGGTVNTVDFDDFKAIGKLKEQHDFWWHIDAAFGGFAACSPKYKHFVKGWEQADSITIDCHKWLNVPYESAFFLINKMHKHLQIETFQNANAPYLGDPLEHFTYLNFLPENSRRLKALPAWFTLLAYGKEGYREIVENSIAMAQKLGDFINNNEVFELLAPVRLNTVCFTLKGEENQEKVTKFLEILNNSGKVFMTPTAYNSRKGIRAAFVNWRTTEVDIEIAVEEMKRAHQSILH